MIGYLQGRPEVIDEDELLVHTGSAESSVGYSVLVGATVIARARAIQAGAIQAGVGQASAQNTIGLHIYTHVREDALSLFGFSSSAHKKLFVQLIGISGVGPKTALGIVELGVERIVTAVQQAEVQCFTSVPRVGKKVAQKIIIDLKSKLGSISELDLEPLVGTQSDVVAALVSLGFDEEQSRTVVRSLTDDQANADASVPELLQKAIQTIR